LTIAGREKVVNALHEEIRRNKNARYDHKLHVILLIAQGMTCPEVSEIMGDSVRTIETWVRKFKTNGFSALEEKQRPGRPSKLSGPQKVQVRLAVTKSPGEYGIEADFWDGRSLSRFIQNEYGVVLEIRQCQRLLREMESTYRKNGPMNAGTGEKHQEGLEMAIHPKD